mmetsp:Transcript_25421/g.80271  ORF Transcript_25421/g.80271 Transcript_25421/m.80271 type:complete len:248 (-) Transcript_25421:3710-4453(-)
MAGHQGELNYLGIHQHGGLGLLGENRDLLLSVSLLGGPCPHRVRHEPSTVHLPLQVRPPLRRLPRRGPQRPGPLRHPDHSVEHRVELGLVGGGAQPQDELAAEHVESLVEFRLGNAPRVEGGAVVPDIEQPLVELVSRGQEGHAGQQRGGRCGAELGRREVAQHQHQVRVDVAHVPDILVQDVLVWISLDLAAEAVVPAKQHGPQTSPHDIPQLPARPRQHLPGLRGQVQPAEGLAADRVVCAALVL